VTRITNVLSENLGRQRFETVGWVVIGRLFRRGLFMVSITAVRFRFFNGSRLEARANVWSVGQAAIVMKVEWGNILLVRQLGDVAEEPEVERLQIECKCEHGYPAKNHQYTMHKVLEDVKEANGLDYVWVAAFFFEVRPELDKFGIIGIAD